LIARAAPADAAAPAGIPPAGFERALMRILFCGDVMGRSGREAVIDNMAGLRRKLALDFVVINGENAAGGYGITDKLCQEFYSAGVDCITTGNHVWDQRELIGTIDRDQRLLRPLNFPKATPGRGAAVYTTKTGRKVLVANVMTRLFMDALDDPFAALEAMFAQHRLTKGTAYQTDAGMCGDYDSVIGMKKETAIARFVRKMPGERLLPAEGEATLCATFVETDDATGLAKKVAPLRLGGRLAQAWPE
jgi:calcineurin-like phosphoesterase